MGPHVAMGCAGGVSVKFLQQLLAALVLQLVHLQPNLHQLQVDLLLCVSLSLARCTATPHIAQRAVHRTQQELVRLLLCWLLLRRL